jgi:hypothetical protein
MGGGHFWASALLRGGVRLRSAFICLGDRQEEAPLRWPAPPGHHRSASASARCAAHAGPLGSRRRRRRCCRWCCRCCWCCWCCWCCRVCCRAAAAVLLPCCCRAAAAVHRNAALHAPRGLRARTPLRTPVARATNCSQQGTSTAALEIAYSGLRAYCFGPDSPPAPSPWRLAGWQPAGPEQATLASTNSNACGAGSREWYGTPVSWGFGDGVGMGGGTKATDGQVHSRI